ncbi:MAG: tetratricopeptide repeat protein [Acidobacteria bacterium]|nr:tetratricopeptide repeat protein [Acidobacteriota bacterium]
MKRLWIVVLLAVLAAGGVCGQQTTGAQTSAGVQLEAAIKKEVVDGDLKTAIELYRKLAQATDRPVAAKALLRMGQCYEKLGDTDTREARKAYEQIVREFGDQAAVAAEARTKLAALAGGGGAAGGSTMAVKRVWAGPGAGSSISIGSVSADGRFVSFTDWGTGGLVIHDLATGQDRPVTNNALNGTSGESVESSLISPDSRQLAYNWYNPDGSYDLRVVGLDGSKPRVLRASGNGVSRVDPLAWSPDSRHLLTEFGKTDGTRDMMLMAVADGSTKLLKAMGADRSPGGVFSPDGRYIVWAVKDGISLFEVQTGRGSSLVPDLAPHEVLGWAPDGRHILFSSERSGSKDLWLVAVADGKAAGEPELVKKGYNGHALGFTRAGAFYYSFFNLAREVHITEWDPATGSLVTPLQPVSQRWVGVSRNPDWSPDGRFLAYIRNSTSKDSSIVVRSTSTGEERELQVGKMTIGMGLRWAQDGSAIVVPAFESGRGGNLMRVDAQSGHATPLMPLPGNWNYPRFDLSPDGRTIFYMKHRDVPNANRVQLLARDVQSARETEVIEGVGLNWVSVSPDGKRLVIGVEEDRSLVLRVLPATGGEAREVVRIPADEANYRVWASWTQDGRYLIFAKGQKGRPTGNVQAWRVATEGGEPQRLGLTVDELWWLRLHPDGRRLAIGTWKTSAEAWMMENFLPKAAAAPVARAK